MSWKLVPCIFPLFVAPACSTPHRLEYAEIDSVAMGRTLAYAVWAPLDRTEGERLPLIVFLHGGGGDAECFDDAGAGQLLDEALASGRIPRAVIAVPDGELGFWENWYDGSRRYRDWVIDEVIPAVQTRFDTGACPDDCHVAGVSMGAHGALRFALLEPDRFDSVSALSGLVLGADDVAAFAGSWLVRLFVPFERVWGPLSDRERIESEDIFRRWRNPEDLNGLRLFVAWAEHDRRRIIESSQAFRNHLLEAGIDHDHLVFPGRHAWKDWTPVLEEVLRFAVWGSIDAEGPGEGVPESARSTTADPSH